MIVVASCKKVVYRGTNGGIRMKKTGLVLLTLLMLSLTGCLHEYQLTEESTEVVAEYMAGVLLNKDENYERHLLSWEELNITTEEDAERPDNSGNEDIGDESKEEPDKDKQTPIRGEESTESNKDYTITEVIGADHINISYNSYKFYNVYPEDETNAYFSLTPMEGNQLLVVSFTAENLTDKEKRLDLRKSKVDYQLDINVGTIYKPLLTLLENNLKYIDMKIGAGKKEEVLLIYEISKDLQVDDINLIISNGAKTEIIDIK